MADVGMPDAGAVDALSVDVAEPVALVPEPVSMRRLTNTQYRNAIADILGDSIVTPSSTEPDVEQGGFFSVGASVATISPRGVEQFERAAFSIAGQALDGEDASARDRLVGCTPEATVDDACATDFVTNIGRRLWRRPLTDDEISAHVGLARQAADALGDFHDGLEYALAGLLQAPSFLFRIELGEDDPDEAGARRFTAWEMAARLSFFLWNTTPDDELIASAESGELLTDAGLEAQARRLLDDDRARLAVRDFFVEHLQLHRLDEMAKDPKVYKHFAPELGPEAREETLRVLERIIFDEDADFRKVFTTHRTFVNRRLAAVYNVRAPAREGFAEVTLPEDGPRRGILGHVSFLALHSHPVATSPTLRGKFIREALLCGVIPLPPADLNTALPEPSGTARTLRERVDEHLTNPDCATCHLLMDPIGLGLENFDGVGRFRTSDHEALIDPKGDVDGEPYGGPAQLGEVLHDDPRVGPCLAKSLFRYATGHIDGEGEKGVLSEIYARFEESGFSVRALMLEIVMSPGFRRAGELQ